MDLLSDDPLPPPVGLLHSLEPTKWTFFDRIQGIRSWLGVIESLARAPAR